MQYEMEFFYFYLKFISAFCIAFMITFYLVAAFRSFALKFNITDRPDGNLKKHEQPVAYLGGVAVFFGFVISLAILYPNSKEIFLLLPLTFLLFLGLLDDLVSLSPFIKFAGQFLAAIGFVKLGFYLSLDYLPWYLNIGFSIFWYLSVINAINLVDIMDGLATSLCIASLASFFIFSILLYQNALALFLVILIGCAVAFLYYNREPASIYLGDAGSLFLVGCIAAIPLLIDWTIITPLGIFAPLIILCIPLLEISQLVLIRTYKGIPFYKGSRDHFAHYLMYNGWSKIAIIDYVYVLSIFLFFISYWLVFEVVSFQRLTILFLFFLIIWAFFLLKKKP